MVSCQWPNVWPEVSTLSWSFVVSMRTGPKTPQPPPTLSIPFPLNFNLSLCLSLSLQKLERSKRRFSMSYVEPQPILECLVQRLLVFLSVPSPNFSKTHDVSSRYGVLRYEIPFQSTWLQSAVTQISERYTNISGGSPSTIKIIIFDILFLSMIFLLNAMSSTYRRV